MPKTRVKIQRQEKRSDTSLLSISYLITTLYDLPICIYKYILVFPQAPFPLRVTRVVTAVLPSSLVARRVSVEDPPPELDNPLPEQIPHEMQQRLAEQSKKMLNKPPRRLLMESPEQNQSSAEMDQDQPVKKTYRQQHQEVLRSSKRESRTEASRAESSETSGNQVRDQAGLGNGSASLDVRVRNNELKWKEIKDS